MVVIRFQLLFRQMGQTQFLTGLQQARSPGIFRYVAGVQEVYPLLRLNL